MLNKKEVFQNSTELATSPAAYCETKPSYWRVWSRLRLRERENIVRANRLIYCSHMKNDLLPHSSATTAWTTYGNISFMKTFMLYMWISRSSSSSTRAAESKKQFFLLLIFPLFFHRVLVVPPHTVRAYHHHNHHHLSRGPNAEAFLLRLIQWSFMLYNIATSSLSVAEEACKKKLRRGKKMKVQGQEIEFLCWSSLSLSRFYFMLYVLLFLFSSLARFTFFSSTLLLTLRAARLCNKLAQLIVVQSRRAPRWWNGQERKKNSEWSSTARKYLSTFGSRRLSSIVWGAEFFRARSFPSRILCYVLLRHSIRALERRQQRERRKIKFLEFLLSFMFRLLGLCCNTTELNKSGLDFFFFFPFQRAELRREVVRSSHTVAWNYHAWGMAWMLELKF